MAPVNLFLHALFSQVSLNKGAIASSSNTYTLRAYIETLLSSSRNKYFLLNYFAALTLATFELFSLALLSTIAQISQYLACYG